MLKTHIEEIEPNKIALKIEVESEKVKAAYTNFFQRAANSVNIPGFRRGKIPRPVLMKHLGPEAIRDQITEELVQDAYPRAVKETKIHPVSKVEIEDINLKEGEPFTFKAIVEVSPKVPDFSYKGRKIEVKRVSLDDESVQRVLKRLQEQFAKITPQENGELIVGDYFSGNIEVKVDGQTDGELSQQNAYIRVHDGDTLFKPLLGVKPGETRTFTHTMNDEKEKDSPHFGKNLNYTVHVQQISRPILPELNDDFAREVGEYQSLDNLREKIREDLDDRFRKDAEESAVEHILRDISKEVEFSVPDAMVQRTTDFFVENIDRRWRQYGTSLEDYLKKSGKDVIEFRESFREKATFETKIMLIIDAISERESIDVLDSEYRQEVEKRARDFQMTVEKLMEILSRSDGESSIRNSLLKQKVNDFLLKNNEIHYDMVNEKDLNKGDTHGDSCTHSH